MKNKIFKYDFLVVGGGLIGSLAALSLYHKKLKVLVIDNKTNVPTDQRTLAVNPNSRDFLDNLGVWRSIRTQPKSIKKIIIKDYINSSPLVFRNNNDAMGNIIYNVDMLKTVRQRLKQLKILKTNININLDKLIPNKILNISNKNYSFKKIVISVGKNITSDLTQKSIIIDKGDYSYVGFFKHKKVHNSIAYEIFKKEGPLAILPAPSPDNNKSTFIYSTNETTTYSKIQSIIKKNFSSSHGQISFDKKIQRFPITPHLTKYNKNFIYIGDSLKSVHPVAGQGWNLGIKDIQTLNKVLDQYPLDSKSFNSIFYSRRMMETSLYFGFTSLINFLYENQNTFNENLIKLGYQGLQNFSFIRDLFIKQAMGRFNLVD